MSTRTRISRRKLLKLAGVAAGAAALSACAAPTPQVVKETVVVPQVVKETVVVPQTVKETVVVEKPVEKAVEKVVTPPPKAVTFSMLVDANEKVQAAHDAALKEYKELNPHVTVKVQVGGVPDVQQVLPWLAAGTAPDTFRWALDRGPSLGLRNVLHDLAPVAEGMKIVDKYVPAVWNGYKWRDGQVWVLPSDANTFCLWSNPVLFERAGVKDLIAPKTWDDMVKAAKAITKPDPDPAKAIYGFGRATTIAWASWWHYWWIWREGGDYYDGKQLVYKEALIESIKKVKYLIDEKLLPAFDNWQDTWYTGRLGMQEYGQWVIPADVPGPWNDNKPQGKWQADHPRPTFVVSPLPKFRADVPGYSILAGFGYYVPKTNKFLDETVKFLWWQQSHPKHGQMFVFPYNQLPAIKKEVVTHPWLDQPILAAFQEQLKTTKPMSVYPEVLQIIDVCNPDLLINAFLGKITPEQAAEQSYKCAEPIVREAQASR